MSRLITIRNCTPENKEWVLELGKLKAELTLTIPPSKYCKFAPPKHIRLYEVRGSEPLTYRQVIVPFSYDKSAPRPERKMLPPMSPATRFVGELREYQRQVKADAIDNLNRTGTTIISAFPGFGKTCIGINIACKVGLKTLIVCHRVVLINQWQESIRKFCSGAPPPGYAHTPALTKTGRLKAKQPENTWPRVQVVGSTDDLDSLADFYIVNAIILQKKDPTFFKGIGMLIVDECHLIMAERMSECMTKVFPRYLLCLSATPYRTDGLNQLFDMYCGELKVERKLHREHVVYRIDTGFEPVVEYTENGKVNWGSILDAQANNAERNELIVRLCQTFAERKGIMILTKRISQAEWLIARLQEVGEAVTSLIGSQQTYDVASRILVGTTSKCSVGFDHAKLDTLIIAADLEQYFIQALGRVFRTQDGVPVVFDLVDRNDLLIKHFATRKKVYIEHGGSVNQLSFVNREPTKPDITLDELKKVRGRERASIKVAAEHTPVPEETVPVELEELEDVYEEGDE